MSQKPNPFGTDRVLRRAKPVDVGLAEAASTVVDPGLHFFPTLEAATKGLPGHRLRRFEFFSLVPVEVEDLFHAAIEQQRIDRRVATAAADRNIQDIESAARRVGVAPRALSSTEEEE